MLSDSSITGIAASVGGDVYSVARFENIKRFAHAIEAEVHKQDTELIRQMLEALDDGSEHTAQCITNYYIRPCDCKKVTTISAARARLENA